MKTYSVTLQATQQLATGTMAFHFTKPKGYEFVAGQAADWSFGEPAASESLADIQHTFSFVSAPHEDELVFATRMRESRYKRRLKALAVGAQLQLSSPFGRLGLDADLNRAAVFIAGGIGITPFISMLRDTIKQQRQQDVVLLYANRNPDEAAYLSELQQITAQNSRVNLVATMTRIDAAVHNWTGMQGHLSAERIQACTQGLQRPVYYVSGPPMLVEAMLDILLDELGVDEEDICSESFTGY